MLFSPPKVTHFHPWDVSSPQAAKHHWLNHGHTKVHGLGSSDAEGPAHGSDDMPFIPASVPVPPLLQANVSLSSITPIVSWSPMQPPHHSLPPTSHNANCHWPDSSDNEAASDAKDQSHGDVTMALQNCLHMSLTNSDMVDVPPPQKLSPKLEPPSSLFTGEDSSPAGPAQQMGLWVLPTSFELPTGTDCDHHWLRASSTVNPSLGMRASLAALKANSQATQLAHAK